MGKGKKSQLTGNKTYAASLILPNLYLGPASSAESSHFLTDEGVTHVLSVGKNAPQTFPNIKYLKLPLLDNDSASLLPAIESTIASIDGICNTGTILIHCSAGISRSPSVVAGYLMRSKRITLHEALGMIVRVRPQVSPNPNFLSQLKDMEMRLFGSASVTVDSLPSRKEDKEAMFGSI
ncbi:putative MAP kinase phosphatase with leucine-rich repeats protein 2 [Hypsibius exemplaris]|uniref:protein-tyrosine-phosphatase n=1 Tax=Hypsibius exemplaris TaxID=2072580 RepID=A0A1W0WEA8_HYPEX|nr:putative MAP kinase phosphatase with leucine-rich repeats protein 2 [Hypsibius exemplaris]